VMCGGRILEAAPPRQIYLAPHHPETASVTGSINLLSGESFGVTVRCALGQLPIAHPCRLGPMRVLIRPEAIRLRQNPPGAKPRAGAPAEVDQVQFHGNHQHVLVRLTGGETLRVRVGPEQSYQPGQRVLVQVPEPVVCFSEDATG